MADRTRPTRLPLAPGVVLGIGLGGFAVHPLARELGVLAFGALLVVVGVALSPRGVARVERGGDVRRVA